MKDGAAPNKVPSFAALARTQVLIEQYALVDDGYGGMTKSWSPLGTFWALIEPVRAREVFSANEIQAKATHRVLIRYQSALSDTSVAAKLRVSIGSRSMNVSGLVNLHEDQKTEGKVYQRLFCIEGDPA